jgi:glycosyltransferase involved in cell wall biosynthesis
MIDKGTNSRALPIKVLHIIQGRHFGGAEQVVLTLVKHFDRSYVDSAVLCLSRGLLLNKLTAAGIPNFLIPMKTKRDIMIPLLKTIKLIKSRNFDIVHTHTVRSNLIGRLAALFTSRKCITHLHSPILRDFADLRRGRLNEMIDFITRPLAARYIAVSHSLRREMIQRGMLPNKIVTIHNALDFESMQSSVNPVSVLGGIRKEYNIPANAFILVLVALLRPRKGVNVIIQAMESVSEHFSNAHLLIVGNDDISEDPDYGNKLRRMASGLGIESNVIFTGFRDDVPAILKECDLMVLPSLFGEGFPMVILESMAMGIPVVASRVEGIPEIVDDGVNGFLVEPGDAEDLANKLIELLKNPILLKTAGRKAQEKMTNEMDGHRQAKIEKVYREVLA